MLLWSNKVGWNLNIDGKFCLKDLKRIKTYQANLFISQGILLIHTFFKTSLEELKKLYMEAQTVERSRMWDARTNILHMYHATGLCMTSFFYVVLTLYGVLCWSYCLNNTYNYSGHCNYMYGIKCSAVVLHVYIVASCVLTFCVHVLQHVCIIMSYTLSCFIVHSLFAMVFYLSALPMYCSIPHGYTARSFSQKEGCHTSHHTNRWFTRKPKSLSHIQVETKLCPECTAQIYWYVLRFQLGGQTVERSVVCASMFAQYILDTILFPLVCVVNSWVSLWIIC